MSKEDALQAFRTLSMSADIAGKVGAGDVAALGELDLTELEQEMIIGAAAEISAASDDVAGFQWTDPAGGGSDNPAEYGGTSTPHATFTRTGDIWAVGRYTKQLTHYVGLGKPTM